ncbi:hypothetical protein [Candidatus Uabimicrobium sp. HlEnr_7]|uniref:hypothetical protein n=1 Tax=Candidatus Uabimicrobium helgolandensis TaxID=3095367 RepID=UPI0035581F81
MNLSKNVYFFILLNIFPLLLAEPITVLNAGFENNVLGDGAFVTFADDWILSNIEGGDGLAGSFNPNSSQLTNEALEGNNIGFSNGQDFSQVLSDVLIANTAYTLTVGVGDRADTAFPGYRIQFLAGGTVLAEDNNTQASVNDGFITSTVEFIALVGDANLGEALEIRLINPGGAQLNFDNVQLNATAIAVPEPSIYVLLLLFCCLGFLRKNSFKS